MLNYARFVSSRVPGSWRAVLDAVRAVGYSGRFSRVRDAPELNSPWRQAACSTWNDGSCQIPGWMYVYVGDASQLRANEAAVMAASRMLKEIPRLNVARLWGRIYQRHDPDVMIHVQVGPESLRSYTLNASSLTSKQLRILTVRHVRRLVEAEAHPLGHVNFQVLAEWMREGFIASPAGCMMSLVGTTGVLTGFAALTPQNGIPLAICVGEIEDGFLPVALTPDHRVFDATHVGAAYSYLGGAITELV